jgi:hypothetical protein
VREGMQKKTLARSPFISLGRAKEDMYVHLYPTKDYSDAKSAFRLLMK